MGKIDGEEGKTGRDAAPERLNREKASLAAVQPASGWGPSTLQASLSYSRCDPGRITNAYFWLTTRPRECLHNAITIPHPPSPKQALPRSEQAWGFGLSALPCLYPALPCPTMPLSLRWG